MEYVINMVLCTYGALKLIHSSSKNLAVCHIAKCFRA